MKTLRNLVLFLINVFAFHLSNACGGWEEYDTYFRLFNPEYVIPGNEFAPISYSDETWHEHSDWFSFKSKYQDNINSWKEVLPTNFSDDEIKEFVYNSIESDLRSAKNGIVSSQKRVLAWVTKNKSYILDYLMLAIQSEEYCNNYDSYWGDEPEIDYKGIGLLIDKGLEEFKQCRNVFIKERYAFQLVKLMRYAERNEECLKFWKEYTSDNQRKNMIYYWTLDHIAGIQIAHGDKIKAWKNFIKVFKECPSRRYSSYYSIKIRTNEDWQALYNACDKDWQQETMHFLRASHMGSIALSDIEAIYNINPKSNYLPSLICREINKIESLYLQNQEKENLFYQLHFNNKILSEELHEYLMEFTAFIDKTVVENIMQNKGFCQISASYLHLLLNHHEESKLKLNELSDKYSDVYKKQVSIIKALLLITDSSKDPIVRQNELKNLWSSDVHDFTYFLMRHPSNKLPFPLNEKGKMWHLKMNLDTKKLEALVDITSNYKDLSWFANYVLETNYLTASNSTGNYVNVQKLTEMLGTCYLVDDEYEKAVRTFSMLDEGFILNNEYFNLEYNPFNYIINDNDCSGLNKKYYSKLKFAKIMVAINSAIENGTATETDYYLLGNAYYNTSYFGYNWMAKAYYRSGGYVTGVFDCSLAYENYIKAAELSGDKEMQAKCYYLAAKANQNLYITQTLNTNSLWDINLLGGHIEITGHKKEFEILRDNYADTEFHKRIIQECKYFDYYLTIKPGEFLY